MPCGRIPADEGAAMADAYRAGATLAQVAERFGWSESAVRKAILARGVAMRPAARPRTSVERWMVWIEEYRAGGSVRRVALRHGVTPRAVRYALDLLGEPRRSAGCTRRMDYAQVERMRQQGLSSAVIARQFGVTSGAVRIQAARARRGEVR